MVQTDAYTMAEYDRSALITIDVQNATLDGGVLEIPGTTAMLPDIGRLCRSFRRATRPIVHMIRIYTPDAKDADRCRRTALLAGHPLLLTGSQDRRPVDALLPDPTLGIDDDRLLQGKFQTIGPNEAVLYKPRWGAFYRTPLKTHLKKKGVSTLVIAGCNYPNCTRATIYEASERDYRITAVIDAISGITPSDVDWLQAIGVNCLTTAQLVALIDKGASECLTQTGAEAP